MTPMDLKDYPPDWPAISLEVRARSGGRCECQGECGRPHTGRCEALNGIHGSRHRETDRWRSTEELAAGVERHGENDSDYAGGSMVVLTVAHLHKGPCAAHYAAGIKCGDKKHLGAFCQACHLGYDLQHHIARRKQNRFAKKAVGDLFGCEAAGLTPRGLWGWVSFVSALVPGLARFQRPALPAYGVAAPAARWPRVPAATSPEGAKE